MAIRKIDTNIGTVPTWGDEDFDANVHENFTSLKNIVPKINNTVDDIDLAVNKMNILKNQAENIVSTADNSKNIAVQKASEASSSANQALIYKNQLQDYVIPAGTSYSVEQINTHNVAMTKAQFNALAEERKANRGGSGFDEWGKHIAISGAIPINDGIFTLPTQVNGFFIGRSSNGIGVSRKDYPVITVNGVSQVLSKILALGNSSNNQLEIAVPTAPNVYPYDTVMTTEQIKSGVIKHADSSNSGLLVNGRLDLNTSGWIALKSTINIVSSSLRITLTETDGGAYQDVPTEVGKKYIFEVDSLFGTNSDISIRAFASGFTTLLADNTSSSQGRKTLEFTATTNITRIYLLVRNAIGKYCNFKNAALFPTDAISRTDLVFLESWHEDISEKNFVYPLGNVQYLGSNTDGLVGIVNGSFSGYETYSLFGNWQASSALIGKGYVWSSLTEEQKKAFIANPENNCYLDGDKVIQVRYRIRVVQGWGDNWDNIDPQNTSSFNYLRYNNSARVSAKGKSVSISSDIGSSAADDLYRTQQNMISVYTKDYGYGLFSVNPNSSTYSYEGKCFALPIVLVHRRNQGMWHHIYNPNGTKLASDGLDCFRTSVSFTSISDCFNSDKLLTASSYIGSVSGRPDGLFYDQIHESDILDLRNNSKKVEDYNRLISREFNKLVAGVYRGKESEWENKPYYSQGNVVKAGTAYGISRYQLGEGSAIIAQSQGYFPSVTTYSILNGFRFIAYITVDGVRDLYVMCQIPNYSGYISNRAIRKLHETAYYSGNSTLVDIQYVGMILVKNEINTSSENAGNPLFFGTKSTRTKSNTLLYCDIIGNPVNYPTAWKESGVFGTPLIVGENGENLLPDGVRDTFKLSRPVKSDTSILLALRSTDNGATWTSFIPTFSTTKNEITLTNEPAGNLVVVYYQTKTSMVITTGNSEVLEIGDVFAGNSYLSQYGSYLANNLIGKTPIADIPVPNSIGQRFKLNTIEFGSTNILNVSRGTSTHNAISLFSNSNPAVKVFPYLTRTNGKAFLNLVFKEMKHNGTSWGDDSKFNIVDNISSTTDNNGQSILIGQKTVELPYFIGADE